MYLQLMDRSNRFDYLLKQTEIFSHFMGDGTTSASSPLKIKSAGRPRKTPDEKQKLVAIGEYVINFPS